MGMTGSSTKSTGNGRRTAAQGNRAAAARYRRGGAAPVAGARITTPTRRRRGA